MQGVPTELAQQIILVPYDPSCVEYEPKPVANGIMLVKVKQEGVPNCIRPAENDMPNIPIITEASISVCPKIKASSAEKQKDSFRIQGNEDKENKQVKAACSTLVSTPKHEEDLDTNDDGLATQLVQDEKLPPRRVPFGKSPSRSNKPLMRYSKGKGRKQLYDLI